MDDRKKLIEEPGPGTDVCIIDTDIVPFNEPEKEPEDWFKE